MIWPQYVLGIPWFQGIYPFPLALPLDQNEKGQPLLSRERAKLTGRGKTENWDSP